VEIEPRSVIGPDHQLPAHVPTRPRRSALRIALWSLLAVAVVIGTVLLVRHHERAKKVTAPPPKIAVTTVAAIKGDVGVYLESIGTVTPVYTDSITSQVNGLVEAVHFTEGQDVKEGDPLIDIDSRAYQATLMQAQGVLERDENVLGQASMDLERYRAAWARNAVAKQTLDDQEKVVLQDTGTVKNDRGTVAYDQVQVDYCHITSPISGRVGLRLVDPGNVVQSTGAVTLAVVAQIDPITVIFTIPEDTLGPVQARIRQGAKLDVDAFDRALQKKLASGTLLTLDNQIDTTTGTVRARALFGNSSDALFPNQFVNARLLVDTLRGVTLVPGSSIQQNGAASFVYVIQNDVAHTRTVKPGISEKGMTQVDGISPGDVIANSSFDRLHDDAPVAASTAAPAPAPAPSAAP
jgi:membrane fusion protein, multidrug efflux system